MMAPTVAAEAIELLDDIATRAHWEVGIGAPEIVAKYSAAARALASKACEQVQHLGFAGTLTWRGVYMRAAKLLLDGSP